MEDLVKKWEMEASHKRYEDWKTINHEKYKVRANGGKHFEGEEASKIGIPCFIELTQRPRAFGDLYSFFKVIRRPSEIFAHGTPTYICFKDNFIYFCISTDHM